MSLFRCLAFAVLTVCLVGCGDEASEVHPVPSNTAGAGPYVLVLGTAQDGGFPQIGCDEPLCQAARRDPARRRLVSSLLICDPRSRRRWLVDATPDIKAQVDLAAGHPPGRAPEGARPPLFEGVFLTHAHIGHYAGLIQLGREVYGAKGLPVHGTKRLCDFLRSNGPWSLMAELGQIELRVSPPGRPVRLADDLTVTPWLVPHRDEFSDTVAFRIEGPEKSLLFLPDIDKWDRWERRIEDEVAAVDHALLDGTFFAEGEIPGRAMKDIPHPFIEESLERFAALPAAERAKICFTHLNHTNPASAAESPAAGRVRKSGFRVASEGMMFDL